MKNITEKVRLQPENFDLPIIELRQGYRADKYFLNTRDVLAHEKARVVMQVFQRKNAILCGIDEVLSVLRFGTGYYKDREKAESLFKSWMIYKEGYRRSTLNKSQHEFKFNACDDIELGLDALWSEQHEDLVIHALHDSDEISPWETVMHVEGELSHFAHLETLYLGILARQTLIATNVRAVVNVANGKPVHFFPARFDHWATQEGDGHAAHIGGAAGVSTDAQGYLWAGQGTGTMPHALIAALGGDTVKAASKLNEHDPSVNLVALVDFENDCIKTALECARALGDKLWGVRLDTSESMVDKSVFPMMGDFKPTGVVPELVFMTRRALDREGFQHVKIIVSGGFNPDKIAMFENLGVPTDAYGVGSGLLRGSNDFTADVVGVNGEDCAKAGRSYRPNTRMTRVQL